VEDIAAGLTYMRQRYYDHGCNEEHE